MTLISTETGKEYYEELFSENKLFSMACGTDEDEIKFFLYLRYKGNVVLV